MNMIGIMPIPIPMDSSGHIDHETGLALYLSTILLFFFYYIGRVIWWNFKRDKSIHGRYFFFSQCLGDTDDIWATVADLIFVIINFIAGFVQLVLLIKSFL